MGELTADEGPRPPDLDKIRALAPFERSGSADGPYQVQAAISALHAQAKHPEDTDWAQIAALYGELMRMTPSPVIELNRAVAVAMADGSLRGLALLNQPELEQALHDYYLFHAARADLLRRAGQLNEASVAYIQALDLCQNERERAFLRRRLTEVSPPTAMGEGCTICDIG